MSTAARDSCSASATSRPVYRMIALTKVRVTRLGVLPAIFAYLPVSAIGIAAEILTFYAAAALSISSLIDHTWSVNLLAIAGV